MVCDDVSFLLARQTTRLSISKHSGGLWRSVRQASKNIEASSPSVFFGAFQRPGRPFSDWCKCGDVSVCSTPIDCLFFTRSGERTARHPRDRQDPARGGHASAEDPRKERQFARQVQHCLPHALGDTKAGDQAGVERREDVRGICRRNLPNLWRWKNMGRDEKWQSILEGACVADGGLRSRDDLS